MALLPNITFVNEAGGGTLMEVPGVYSLPSLNDYVWLGEEGEALVEYKVERIDHEYISDETTNPETSRVYISVNGHITITVSVVVP